MARSAREVLAQLDASAEELDFPMLDNGYYYPVDTRLHVFADADRWALVIETLGYNPRGGNLFDVLHAYGDCIDGPPGSTNLDFLERIENMDEITDPDDPETWRPRADALAIRGRRVAVSARPGERLEQVFRSLVPEHRDELLATEDELRRRVPADVPKILQLEEWHHPDLAGDERPSDSPTFRQLAEVIETGDVARYRPREAPNTHWSNWPAGGTL